MIHLPKWLRVLGDPHDKLFSPMSSSLLLVCPARSLIGPNVSTNHLYGSNAYIYIMTGFG